MHLPFFSYTLCIHFPRSRTSVHLAGIGQNKNIPLTVANFSLTSMFQTEQRGEDEPLFPSLMLSEADKKLQATPPPTHCFFLSPLINALNDGNQSRKWKIYSPILILLSIDWGAKSITAINAFWGVVLSCLPLKTSRSSFISTVLLHL